MTRARDLAAFVSNADGDIKFDTDTLFIDSSANKVGIGTDSPNRALTLEDGDVQIHETSTGDPLLNFSVGGTQASPTQSWSMRIDNSDSDKFQLMDVTDSRIVLTADGDGNVGIGNSNPDQRLTIGDNTTATEIIQFKNTSNALVYFGDAADADVGYLNYNHGANYFRIGVNAAERMRIDSNGVLMVGKTSSDGGVVGHELRNTSFAVHTVAGNPSLYARRLTNDGDIMILQDNSGTIGSISAHGGSLNVGGGDVGIGFYQVSDVWAPISPATGAARDNAIDLGFSSGRFDDIFATNSSIQTSDEREKQNIASLTNAEITAAKAISKLFKTFKWKDKVAAKGDAARTHTGVIAQQVEQAMTDAGLTASNYAFWCSDTWWETQTEVAAVEADEENGIEAKAAYTRTDTYQTEEEAPEGATERNRKGIRYPELLSFIGAATEQRLTSIEARLDALEA